MKLSQQVCWGGLLFSPSVDHVLSELYTMTHLSWMALHGMAYSFNELHKALCPAKAVIHKGQTQRDGEGQGVVKSWTQLGDWTRSCLQSMNKLVRLCLLPRWNEYTLPQGSVSLSLKSSSCLIVIHVLEVQMTQVYYENMIVKIDVIFWTAKYMNLKIGMKKLKSPPHVDYNFSVWTEYMC